MTENACTFERAGEFNVSYQVTDEEGNSANASYKITVKGLYLNEKAFVSKVFQLAEYEIAEAKVYGIENAAVKVTLAQGDEINEVAMGAKVKFLNVSDAVLKYVLSVGEEEKEIIEKTVKITALDLMISAADFSATEGDEITIPSASLSHETAGVTVSVKISGQYQEEQAVAQGDKIIAASGVTDITYTAENEDKSFSLTRVISVVAIGKDEIVSFEQVNGDNPDFNVPPFGMKLGNEELNSDPAYVHSGKYSAKLIFGPQRPNANTFGAGFCYWDNQIRNANVEGANGISMWIYCAKKEAYIVAAIATGATGKGYSGARISHVIKLGKGWNEVNINFDYQVYDAGEKTAADGTVLGALDIKNGISELCFYRVKKGAYTNWDSVNGGNYTDYIYDNALSVYVDEVRIRKFEIPDGVYFTFDKKPEATGTMGGTAVATAPRMLVEEGVTLTVAVTAPNGEQTTVNAGDSFDLTLGGYYTLTYKAEKEGKPTQEVSFQILATDPAEFLSFETINGATPDIAKGVYGNVTANTDSQYVKVGKQSAKLETVLNEWVNCTAGFAWDGGALQMPTVENANALTFWMYSEKELHLYATVTTGVSANNTWVCKTSKPIALSVGWNFVTLDVRYSFDALGLDFNNGLQELYFRTGDANAVGKTPATLYIDSVCFSVLPDRVIENLAIDYMNINLPEDQTVLGDREFGMVTRCTDEEYTKNGKPSLKLEMFADEAPLKTMRACYSGWGKGILLTAGENAVKFEVYASRAAFVSFEFGTGGNAGSGAYSGAKFAKVIELKQGWNTVTITFGDNADVQGATLADGIVHFGATTVNSISALPDNGCFPDVASEELTLYVATMYAIVA